ncbi:cAMP phosphodiesterases class-II-domain-containing protein [Aspergillus ambiguus]|uniref:3',5'-cyclic-nucleotide phosphodiesterase PDE1 n=1 Tax=Aspergillus ambiguus TaxID=176160 RepID=UPI003CCD3DC3
MPPRPTKRRGEAPAPTEEPPSKKGTSKKGSSKEGEEESEGQEERPGEGPEGSAKPQKKGLHVIIVGSSGGPYEDETSCILVRSTASQWREKTVLAIDAGTLLGGIRNVLDTSEDAPFADLITNGDSSLSNALHIFQNIVGPICITHPHMDHIAGFVINTQALQKTSSPKTIACLQSVVDALRQYVFNGVLWPNLTDEKGAGLVTFHTLPEGGNIMMGSGDLVGYEELAEKVLVKCYKVTHGECAQMYDPTARRWRRRSSVHPQMMREAEKAVAQETEEERTESSAFFVRDKVTGKEVIVFGDIEPDSISAKQWNKRIWEEAARAFVAGRLKAIFIECSFTDDIQDEFLYGHLCPRHLGAELDMLASCIDPRPEADRTNALKGLNVYLTHIKVMDDVCVQNILKQVRQRCSHLGCKVEVAARGKSYYFA